MIEEASTEVLMLSSTFDFQEAFKKSEILSYHVSILLVSHVQLSFKAGGCVSFTNITY